MGSTGVSAGPVSTGSVSKMSFTNEGFGQWTKDVPGVGGVSILDERDSMRAGMNSGPAYSVMVYDNDGNIVNDNVYFTSLNGAKQVANELLENLINS